MDEPVSETLGCDMFQSFEDDDFGGGKEIVKALRGALAARKMDGFIVPREDEFQGEYVPAAMSG